jgi:DNA polymerase-3 subunit epsilon
VKSLNLERPLAFFDIEATGKDPAHDRIVSLHIKKIRPDGSSRAASWMVNPRVKMSDEVIAIHGITNESVAGLQTFNEVAPSVLAFLKDCDLATFNGSNFDIPILWEELNRSGIKWNLNGVQHVDVGNLFKKKEPRTLTAAVKFYCGRDHEGAHDAGADVDATVAVLEAMIQRSNTDFSNDYSDLALMELPQLAEFSKMEDRVDLAGKLVRNAQGDVVYGFGNSKGVRVQDDPSFARWMLQKDFSENTKEHLRAILYPQRELV